MRATDVAQQCVREAYRLRDYYEGPLPWPVTATERREAVKGRLAELHEEFRVLWGYCTGTERPGDPSVDRNADELPEWVPDVGCAIVAWRPSALSDTARRAVPAWLRHMLTDPRAVFGGNCASVVYVLGSDGVLYAASRNDFYGTVTVHRVEA